MPTRPLRLPLHLTALLAGAITVFSTGASAQGQIEVVFNDPGAVYASYHADIERVTLAAGATWLSHFTATGTAPVLTVRIGFDALATTYTEGGRVSRPTNTILQ